MVSFITDKSDTSLGWLEIVKSHGIEINQREINDLNKSNNFYPIWSGSANNLDKSKVEFVWTKVSQGRDWYDKTREHNFEGSHAPKINPEGDSEHKKDKNDRKMPKKSTWGANFWPRTGFGSILGSLENAKNIYCERKRIDDKDVEKHINKVIASAGDADTGKEDLGGCGRIGPARAAGGSSDPSAMDPNNHQHVDLLMH